MKKFIIIALTLPMIACGHHNSKKPTTTPTTGPTVVNFVPNVAPVLPTPEQQLYGVINPNVIHQGTWGDDWLLITLASLTVNNPLSIANGIQPGTPAGTWNVTLYNHGTAVVINVTNDDVSNPNAQYAAQEPVGSDGNVVMWPRIYEAAFLKLNNQDSSFLVYNIDKDVLDGDLPSYAITGLTNQAASNVGISTLDEQTLWNFAALSTEYVPVFLNAKSTLTSPSILKANHSYYLVSANQATDTLVVFDPALVNSNNGQFDISMSDLITDVDSITAPNANLPTAYINN